jgi:hypothetical protein
MADASARSGASTSAAVSVERNSLSPDRSSSDPDVTAASPFALPLSFSLFTTREARFLHHSEVICHCYLFVTVGRNIFMVNGGINTQERCFDGEEITLHRT